MYSYFSFDEFCQFLPDLCSNPLENFATMQELPVFCLTSHCNSVSLCRVTGLVSAPPVVFYRQPVVYGPVWVLSQLCPLHRLCAAKQCHHYFYKVIHGFAKPFGAQKVNLFPLWLLRNIIKMFVPALQL